jgi:hypothetical protein
VRTSRYVMRRDDLQCGWNRTPPAIGAVSEIRRASQKPFDGVPYTQLALADHAADQRISDICSFQGVVMINRPAPYRLPLWPTEAPSIAPSFSRILRLLA